MIRPENSRYYFASQQIFLLALFLHALFLILFLWFSIKVLVLFNIVSLALYFLVLYLNRKGQHGVAFGLAYLEVSAHAVLAIILLSWGSGFFYYLLAIGPMLFFYPRYHLILKIIPACTTAVILAILFVYSLSNQPVYILSPEVITTLYISNMVSTFGLLSYLAHYYSEGADQSEARFRQLSLKFEKLAISDSLTGLLNRRAVTQEIESEISRYHRNGEPFVLVLGDIDNFKSYNDELGHSAGDKIIKQIANLLVNNTRPYDIISRWGGEEFLMMLPGCHLNDAVKIINDLREKIEAHTIDYNNSKINITMTFGVSEFSMGSSLDESIEAADQALYLGKRMGKNRVETATLNDSGKYSVGKNYTDK